MSTQIETTIIKLDEIEVAEGFNPRRDFNERALGELADSIKAHGITTGLTVRRERPDRPQLSGRLLAEGP